MLSLAKVWAFGRGFTPPTPLTSGATSPTLMKIPLHFLGLAMSLVATPRLLSAAPPAESRPNIVIILADDLGFSDLGCYGGEIATPNIDRLAAEGVRFSQFYNNARCCPTRAALLTGLNPHQAGLGHMVTDKGLPGYRGQIQPATVTIAEALRLQGYRTAMAGKWHVSRNSAEEPDHMRYLNNQATLERFGDLEVYPTRRGFEHYFGSIWGVVNYYDPFSLVEGEAAVPSVPDDFYVTDAITAKAIAYIDEFTARGEPFFLYVSHNAPHWPLHALPDDIDPYRTRYRGGWEETEQGRVDRQASLGVFTNRTTAATRRGATGTDWSGNPDQAYDAAVMAAYAGAITHLDTSVGKMIEHLRACGQLDNTLVVFLSDNGASPEVVKRPGYDRPSETRDGRKIVYNAALRAAGTAPGPETTFAGIGPDWAWVANTPLRGEKASLYEGGVRTPCIVRWPQHTTQPGGWVREVGHVIDLFATCLEAARTTAPSMREGYVLPQTEGVSLLPALAGGALADRMLAWEHEGFRAALVQPWKLVGPPDQPWELYAIDVDPGEQHDVAAEHPALVRALAAAWQNWARRTLVFPAPPAAQRRKIIDPSEH